jgi:VWFA-related protein
MTRGSVVVATLLLVTLLACWPASLLARWPGQQPFKAGTNLVVVPVVVVDGRNATVTGLTADDFRVSEDGKPVTIEAFTAPVSSDAENADTSRFIVLTLDNLSVAAEMVWRVKNIANGFVDRLGPHDVMSVIPLNGGKAVTTNSKAELKAAVSRYSVSGAADSMTFAQRAEHGLRMINSLSAQVTQAPHPRKVMVFLGDANMFSPNQPTAFAPIGGGAPSFDVSPEWDEAIKATARNNVSVYVIDPRGLTGPPGDWSKSFADATGGYAWGRTNNFGAATDQIFKESARYYLIGYTAPSNDNRLHRIDVKVERKGVTVRSRKARR